MLRVSGVTKRDKDLQPTTIYVGIKLKYYKATALYNPVNCKTSFLIFNTNSDDFFRILHADVLI